MLGAEQATGETFSDELAVPSGGFTMALCVPANTTSSALK